jgi:hypothetical protein
VTVGLWVTTVAVDRAGADQDVAIARKRGLPVCDRIEDIPGYARDGLSQ